MLQPAITQLLNEQINKEFYSAYLYLDIANYYIDAGLAGYGHWFQIQAQEERDHALLFLQYLQLNHESVRLLAIDEPDQPFADHKAPLLAALAHERYVTGLIHTIYDRAYTQKDFRTMQFLDWFVKEQMEEENNAQELIDKYELFGSDPKGLYLLDQELAGRLYSPPSLNLAD